MSTEIVSSPGVSVRKKQFWEAKVHSQNTSMKTFSNAERCTRSALHGQMQFQASRHPPAALKPSTAFCFENTPHLHLDSRFRCRTNSQMPTHKKCRCQNLHNLSYPLSIDFFKLQAISVQPIEKSLFQNRRCQLT